MLRSGGVLLFDLASIWPEVALAHPGHGQTRPELWWHYVLEPVHVLGLMAGLAVAALSWAVVRERRSRKRRNRVPHRPLGKRRL